MKWTEKKRGWQWRGVRIIQTIIDAAIANPELDPQSVLDDVGDVTDMLAVGGREAEIEDQLATLERKHSVMAEAHTSGPTVRVRR